LQKWSRDRPARSRCRRRRFVPLPTLSPRPAALAPEPSRSVPLFPALVLPALTAS